MEKDKDVYIMQESGKMVIRDLEALDNAKEEKKRKRTKEGYGEDSDTDSDEDTAIAKKGSNSKQIKKQMKTFNLQKRSEASAAIFKNKSVIQKVRHNQAVAKSGHIEKFSGEKYKSAKGKGDVIKAGKLEPFSYIQLNPRMLNKRLKSQAVKSFEKVVDFGKKEGKRALSGIKVKAKK